jgi:hypothetical protein
MGNTEEQARDANEESLVKKKSFFALQLGRWMLHLMPCARRQYCAVRQNKLPKENSMFAPSYRNALNHLDFRLFIITKYGYFI